MSSFEVTALIHQIFDRPQIILLDPESIFEFQIRIHLAYQSVISNILSQVLFYIFNLIKFIILYFFYYLEYIC